ncbi:UvrD-helicase domain-containing protein [Halorubrum ezzemoulense]|uniref:UvrD-helicase domain-containing protein n=1 Tax=Halorubrum ezzemoulense TaxID=337243 RepID=UPI00232E49EF|nr:UvrD-helicase domain-containing protein [Halorubrum ezzemoulense]MDB2242684.1 UvrD-helicase domain-containing protein [Halorubrum ezzemoulense]
MSDVVPRLDGDQQRMVEAYLGMDQGLAVLGSVPGAGKSSVIGKAAAEDLLSRAATGDPRPHERVLIASFSQEDAADLIPDIVAWIEALYARGATPAALDRSDIDRLCRQVREAPRIGTVDSVLRTIFAEIATEMRFDEMPTVGNPALIEQVHRDAYEAVRTEETELVNRVREAYEDTSVSNLLRDSFEVACRRQLTPAELADCLRAAVTDNYRGGSTTSIDDIIDAVAAYRDDTTAANVEDTLTDAEKRRLLKADQELRAEWSSLVEAFAALYEKYADAYDELTRDRGVITHTDCARLVEAYFGDKQYASPRRERLTQCYREGINSVIIDEAQDVSRIQHDALAHLVADDARILLAGDLDQCVYLWRDATPELFANALEDGEYFGRTWTSHETEQAEKNYRSRPSIVRFANAAAERGLGHGERGGLGEVTTTTPAISATREPTSDSSIHVATFEPKGAPGTDDWIAPKHGTGEADTVARSVASGIDTGHFPSAADDAGISVLFPRRRHMDAYADAFESYGLTVADASAYLFDSSVVCAVIDVIEWLIDPTDESRTRRLLKESTLAASCEDHSEADTGLSTVTAAVTNVGGVLRDDAADDISAPHARVVSGLVGMRDDTRVRHVKPASVLVREIIDRLGLEVDPLGIDPATDGPQRVATLDAFVELVEEWEGDDRDSLSRLHELLRPFVETPDRGPTQPVVDADAVDVVFRTVHDAKGDEDDVVVLADTACAGASWASGMETLVASGDGVALAPPADAVDGEEPPLPGVGGGLYQHDPSMSRTGDCGGHGLRWDAEHWVTEGGEQADLRGPPVRRAASAANRAEWWRTLHVAITRAQEHLVVPIPRTQLFLSERDHWAQVCCEVLDEVITGSGTGTVALPDSDGVTQSTQVAVDDGALHPSVETDGSATVVPARRPGRVTPATDIVGEGWQPRFVRPSLLAPLVDDPGSTLVPILREQTSHTETDTVDPDLPLTFETVGSEQVGELVHTLVGRLVRTELSAEELCGSAARDIAAGVLNDEVDGEIRDDEWVGLYSFLVEYVLPDLAASELWGRVERATTVYIEEPLHGVARVNGVDVEVQGAADLVLVMPEGTYHVEELKVGLAPATDALRRRYGRQAKAYQWVLDQQVDPTVSVESRVTTVGAVAETYAARSPAAGLSALVDQRE